MNYNKIDEDLRRLIRKESLKTVSMFLKILIEKSEDENFIFEDEVWGHTHFVVMPPELSKGLQKFIEEQYKGLDGWDWDRK